MRTFSRKTCPLPERTWPMANLSASAIDRLAKQYEDLQEKADRAEENLATVRRYLIEETLAEGSVPARATKTKTLAGEEYELRVSRPLEVTVDTGVAERIGTKLRLNGCGELF